MGSSKQQNGHASPAASKATARTKWCSLPVIGIMIAVGTALCLWLERIGPSFYHFSPEGLNTIFQETLASQSQLHGVSYQELNVTDTITELLARTQKAYPNTQVKTEFRDRDQWVWNNAGGAMGSMYIIHASLTEYLIIFGSAVGTEGHSGRHTADDYFHILKGQQMAYLPGELEPEVYPAGTVHHMRRGDVKQYRIESETWALEYAQGWIPLMLPFGFADTLFSTLDVGSFWKTAKLTAIAMIENLMVGKI